MKISCKKFRKCLFDVSKSGEERFLCTVKELSGEIVRVDKEDFYVARSFINNNPSEVTEDQLVGWIDRIEQSEDRLMIFYTPNPLYQKRSRLGTFFIIKKYPTA